MNITKQKLVVIVGRGKMGGTVRKDSRDCTQEGTGESNISETVFSGGKKKEFTHMENLHHDRYDG